MALCTCSLSKPMLTICVTASSYNCPVTRALSALVVLISDLTDAELSDAAVKLDSDTVASVELFKLKEK